MNKIDECQILFQAAVVADVIASFNSCNLERKITFEMHNKPIINGDTFVYDILLFIAKNCFEQGMQSNGAVSQKMQRRRGILALEIYIGNQLPFRHELLIICIYTADPSL